MKVERCDNEYCLYWDDCACTLDCISLDIRGICESFAYIEFAGNELLYRRIELIGEPADKLIFPKT